MIADPAELATTLAGEAGLAGVGVEGEGGRQVELGGVSLRIVAIGWATVELDRAAAELAEGWSSEGGGASPSKRAASAAIFEPGAPDDLLGASTRVGRPMASGPTVVLLEPRTEGLLAAALARRGEGPAVLFLATVEGSLPAALDRLASAGIRTRSGHGPVGEAALVLGRPSAEPQLIVVAVPSGS